jgi:hypothetical protein
MPLFRKAAQAGDSGSRPFGDLAQGSIILLSFLVSIIACAKRIASGNREGMRVNGALNHQFWISMPRSRSCAKNAVRKTLIVKSAERFSPRRPMKSGLAEMEIADE